MWIEWHGLELDHSNIVFYFSIIILKCSCTFGYGPDHHTSKTMLYKSYILPEFVFLYFVLKPSNPTLLVFFIPKPLFEMFPLANMQVDVQQTIVSLLSFYHNSLQIRGQKKCRLWDRYFCVFVFSFVSRLVGSLHNDIAMINSPYTNSIKKQYGCTWYWPAFGI